MKPKSKTIAGGGDAAAASVERQRFNLTHTQTHTSHTDTHERTHTHTHTDSHLIHGYGRRRRRLASRRAVVAVDGTPVVFFCCTPCAFSPHNSMEPLRQSASRLTSCAHFRTNLVAARRHRRLRRICLSSKKYIDIPIYN